MIRNSSIVNNLFYHDVVHSFPPTGMPFFVTIPDDTKMFTIYITTSLLTLIDIDVSPNYSDWINFQRINIQGSVVIPILYRFAFLRFNFPPTAGHVMIAIEGS